MTKSINTTKNNNKKGKDVPGGEAGPPNLGSPVESSAGETTPTHSIETTVRDTATLPEVMVQQEAVTREGVGSPSR